MTKKGDKYRGIVVKIFSKICCDGTTITDIAREIGVTQQAISSTKSGRTAPSLELLAYYAQRGGDLNELLTGVPTAARTDDSALRLVLRDWADLSDDDRVRLSGEVRQLAAEARAKKGQSRFRLILGGKR